MSLTTTTFSISAFPGTQPRSARRIAINADLLRSQKVCAGDTVLVYSTQQKAGHAQVHAAGVAWPALSVDLPANIIGLSTSLLSEEIAEVKDARLAVLSGAAAWSNKALNAAGLPLLKEIKEASYVQVIEVGSVSENSPVREDTKGKGKSRDWLMLLVRELLVDLKYIRPGQMIAVVYENKLRTFQVVKLSQQSQNMQSTAVPELEDVLTASMDALDVNDQPRALWTVGWDTSVVIQTPDDANKAKKLTHTSTEAAYSSIGGLNSQITQIRDLLEIPLTRPDLFHHFGLKPPRGILLHGPPGTGKTHLARLIAQSTASSLLVINGPELSSAYHGETEAKLRAVFEQAKRQSPCVIVLDEIDALAPSRGDTETGGGGGGGGGGEGGETDKRVVATLLTAMDGMEEGLEGAEKPRVVVVGTTNRPNAIDPALRRPGRFDREIEIGVPDAEARTQILRVLLAKVPHSLSPDDLRALAGRAHGYVGADLSAVVREAGTLAIKRWLATAREASEPIPQPSLTLTLSDLDASLPTIRPSALRSLYLSLAPLHFSSIGGQRNVISSLRQLILWPLLHAETFTRLGITPPKGVLLYGPPGCSKTILARACATESGVNFVAVRGPEVVSKYVGESERKVREVFRRARAVKPCIVFFDEIDALATSRGGADGGGGGGVSAAHEGVLMSLLNEMDGVQELLGVTIIAATNRPGVIDSALMRPGRLDRLLYVGPPDKEGREEILRIQMGKMTVAADVDVVEIAQAADGCSGAETVSICQEAAMLTMQEDMNAPSIPHSAFMRAAKIMKRQITVEVVKEFKDWGAQYERK